MKHLKITKLKLGIIATFLMAFIIIGIVGLSKKSNNQQNIHVISSSSDEKQPYVKPCNSLESCFTIVGREILNENA